MLRARRAEGRSSHDINVDGTYLTRWDRELFRGGRFVLEGGRYLVGVNTWGTTYTLTDRTRATVATASNPNRRRWTIVAGNQTYEFHRRAWWRQHYDLVVGGQAVGFIHRPNLRAEATAELPAMPLAIQVFALVLALTTWDAIALLVRPF